jgi:hypothetical protein
MDQKEMERKQLWPVWMYYPSLCLKGLFMDGFLQYTEILLYAKCSYHYWNKIHWINSIHNQFQNELLIMDTAIQNLQ